GARLVGMVPAVEVQRGQAVLAVNDQVLPAGLFEVAGLLEAADRLETQPLRREEQNRPRDRRLAHGGLVEVRDGLDLGARELALKGLVAALDPGDELRDLVLFGDLGRRDLLALAVEPADELDLPEQVLRRIGDEVEEAVLLTDSRGKHGVCSSRAR